MYLAFPPLPWDIYGHGACYPDRCSNEDGLSDVADAFWSERTMKERFTIMKDSRIGVFVR